MKKIKIEYVIMICGAIIFSNDHIHMMIIGTSLFLAGFCLYLYHFFKNL